jgi:adenylate kinase
MNVVFIGPPGSGKGTQALMLAKTFNVPAISTGEILRKEVSEKSSIGLLAKEYMDSGKLVPDDVVIDIVKKRLQNEDCSYGFIIDGFPRNVNQSQILEKVTTSIDKKIELVVNFEIDDDVVIKRISGRITCDKCGAIYNKYFNSTKVEGVCDNCGHGIFSTRADDNELTIKNRLEVYKNSSAELVNFYNKNGLLISVRATESPALIFESLVQAISRLNK